MLPVMAAGQARPLTPDDLLRLEAFDGGTGTFSPVVISPDGRIIAYVIKRAKTTAGTYSSVHLNDLDHADVWIVDANGGQPRNITHGAADKAGFWAPAWSPDGRLLAMLSTRGGNV